MYEGNKILAVIPARGGSKGIPHKNLCKIAGRSLVEWALFTAMKCKIVDRIIVSSDSQQIIRKVNKHGNFSPFIRPEELARDDSRSLPVFQHAHRWAEEEDRCKYGFVVALEPTCPFRLPLHIEKGVELAVKTNASSIMSLVKVSDYHPVRIKKLLSNGRIEPFCISEPEGLRRQEQEPAYIRNGAVLVFPSKTILQNRLWGDLPYGFVMDEYYYKINIDEGLDLIAASHLYRKLKETGKLGFIDCMAV